MPAQPPAFTPPSSSELDCLLALWEAAATADSGRSLRVSEVHRAVCERRRRLGEVEPTLVTVSTQMRSLLQKNLVKSVVGGRDSEQAGRDLAPRTRGMLSPASRSPLTAYQFLFQPGEVLQSTFLAMIGAYPQTQQVQSLIDFAEALATTGAIKELPAEGQLDLLRRIAGTLGVSPKIQQRLKTVSK